MTYDIKRLTVKYNLITVGFLESLSEDVIAFQYDETWVKEGFSISQFIYHFLMRCSSQNHHTLVVFLAYFMILYPEVGRASYA